jgi:nicotinamide mononucleotide adenylyltransferase
MLNSLFIGRWQCIPPHSGHIALIETVLNEGKNVLIAIRDTEKDENNPYPLNERRKALRKAFSDRGWNRDRIKIIAIPDIKEVVYGRKVGYGIREIKLSPELEAISATEIRKKNKEKDLWR